MILRQQRSIVRNRINLLIGKETDKLRLELFRHRGYPPDTYPDVAIPQAGSLFDLAVQPTEPPSMRLMVNQVLGYQRGLRHERWPGQLDTDAARYSPYFRPIASRSDSASEDYSGHFRVDLLFLSHLDTLDIAEGSLQDMTGFDLSLRDRMLIPADLPTVPDRGTPLAYVFIWYTDTELVRDQIFACRPVITSIRSDDVDVESWEVTDDLSSSCDGTRMMFATELPFAKDSTRVELNGIVQQRDVSYTESGGSLGLTFAPHTGESLVAVYELGEKDDYSGYGMTPWGTGLYGV